MTEVNVPLLRKAVEWVEQQDQLSVQVRQWYQQSYVVEEDKRVWELGHERGCGTAYCVAGYIGSLVDERYVNEQWAEGEDGELVHVSAVAQEALGLNDALGASLFAAYNDAPRIREIAEQLAGEKL